MIVENELAILAGLSAIPLKSKSKAPFQNNWTELSTHSLQQLEKLVTGERNIGARLGAPSKLKNGDFLYVLDVDYDSDHPDDIRDCEAVLDKLIRDWRDFPMVQSGSGGRARHIYFTSDRAMPSGLIAKSEFTVPVNGKKKPCWQIDRYGTGKQVVIPPSIHPDTGNAYVWLKPMDWQRIIDGEPSDWFIPGSQVAAWTDRAEKPAQRDHDEDGLSRAVHTDPLGISEDEAWDDLKVLPEEWNEDYEPWLKVGAALEHEFEGDQAGLDLWHDFSKDSGKYEPDVLDAKWETFRDKKNPTTWRTIKLAANKARKARARDDIESDDDKKSDRDWLDRMDQTADGNFLSTVNNIFLALTNDARLKHVICYNEFGNRLVVRKGFAPKIDGFAPIVCTDSVNGNELSDTMISQMRLFLENRRPGGYGMQNVPERNLKDGIQAAAHKNRFHPVREYLTGLEWDGKRRMDRLFVDYIGIPDDDFAQEIAYNFMVSAVARIFEPGHKFDFVPIIRGEQGKRKSTFLATLAVNGAWFGTITISKDERQMIMGMMGKWILELPELAGFSRNDVQHLKQFISSPVDNTRLPWGRTNMDFPRHCVMAGTTNDEAYLRDDSGNRRYWPMEAKIETIDTDRLKANRDQLWAEAYDEYIQLRQKYPKSEKEYLPLYIRSETAMKLAKDAQDNAMEDSASSMWAAKIVEWLEKPLVDRTGFSNLDGEQQHMRVTAKQIWEEAMGQEVTDYAREAPKIVEAAMRMICRDHGWERMNKSGVHRVPGFTTPQRNVYQRVTFHPKVGNPQFKSKYHKLI